jgi:hypothetical protein
MGMRSADRNAKQFACQHIRRSRAASHIRGPAGRQATVNSLRPPKSEFKDGIAFRGKADPGGFGGNQSLKVNRIQKEGFDQLGLPDGTFHPKQWFLWKYEPTFRHSIHIALEFEVRQMEQKLTVKKAGTVRIPESGQIIKIAGVKGKALEPVDHIVESAGNGVSSFENRMPEKEIENSFDWPVLFSSNPGPW